MLVSVDLYESMTPRSGLLWTALPRAARLYVALVIAVGMIALIAFFPLAYPKPILFAALLVIGCLTSIWKVTLPIAVTSGSTLSVSYAADLTALVLLGPRQAMLVAVVGVCAQCTLNIRHPYPLYRTVFSMAAEAITIVATGAAYAALGGLSAPLAIAALAPPLVGAIAAYFVVNTGLVAAAIALSTGRRVWDVWHNDFLWSGASFMVAGTAGAIAAIVIDRGQQWLAVLMLAPVYLTYRTYQLFVGRLELLERERAARASAEEANRLKDQFLAIVSHELRTPLNAILGWADMLRRGTIDEGRRDRAFQAIYDSAKAQAQLIDELLDVARIMSGKLRLEQGDVDIHETTRRALEIVQPDADKHRINIAIDADATIGAFRGDSARLQQIVWNLLTNAVKFTPDGGAVHVRVRRATAGIEIAVADSGRGIPRDFLPHVFEPFRQADGSTTRQHGGLGLGLSIVKHLVEAHGGTVKVESGGEGRGTTFTVALPVPVMSVVGVMGAAPPDERAARVPAPAASSMLGSDGLLEGLDVVVVDDDEESRAIVVEYLRTHRASVREAESAAAALDLLERKPADVLLADIAMPGEDGYSLIRKLRACPSSALASIPAAALTAFARDEDRQQALQAGFQLHLSKPIDPQLLVRAVASLSGKSEVWTLKSEV
jgi:signal transduction histidine kinase/ActR/RegA family two-component response regulator